MLMTQLINPFRYGLFTLMYESESPEGEMLIEYAAKAWNGEKHIGETPIQIIQEVKKHGSQAVTSIEQASKSITKNKADFDKLKNDMYCYQVLAEHYAEKAAAALHILRFKYSHDVKDLDKALPLLQQSVASYKKLVQLTQGSYLYANSMQTQQRKIPMRGVNGTFKTWKEVLVPFEMELNHFQKAIDSLKRNANKNAVVLQSLVPSVVAESNYSSHYTVDSGAVVFGDTTLAIHSVAKVLQGLQGITMDFRQQVQAGTTLSFYTTKPVKLLVGYFNSKDAMFVQAPELETNAAANEYGQSEIKIAHAMIIKGLPTVNVHSYQFGAGKHTLKLAKGACLLLGFVQDDQIIPSFYAGFTENGLKNEIDWLFE
jgi:hypothetical protein